MKELSFEDIIEKVNNNFSIQHLAEFLYFIGLVELKYSYKRTKLSKYIFLEGIEDEIYIGLERNYIENFGEIIVFPESEKNNISYRCFFADLSNSLEDINKSVIFMKLIIKAYDGFPFFVFRFSDGIHFGMRVFNNEPWNNCILSDAEFEQLLENFLYIENEKDFKTLYFSVLNAIRPKENLIDYDYKFEKKRGINYDYINTLNEIGNTYNLDFDFEAKRYISWYEEEGEEENINEIVLDESRNLSDIKSSKVNSLELLFEAEEKENSVTDSYVDVSRLSKTEMETSVDDVKLEFEDPEKLIKQLKLIKGV